MSQELRTILLALGFAVVGSGGTALGFTLAQRDPPAARSDEAGDDTATSRSGWRTGRRSQREVGRSHGAGPQRAGRGHPMGQGAALGRGRGWVSLAEDLDLSVEQRQAWQQMMSDIRSNCANARSQQADTTLELLGTTAAAEPADPEALHALIEARLTTQRQASHCVLNEVLEFHATLEPAQRALIAERVQELQTRRQAWMDAWSE